MVLFDDIYKNEISLPDNIMIFGNYSSLDIRDYTIIENLPTGCYGYIYLIICIHPEHRWIKYVGKHRIYNKSQIPGYFGQGRYIVPLVKELGHENFVKIVFKFTFTPEEHNEQEKFWIAKLSAQPKKDYLNITAGGQDSHSNLLYHPDRENIIRKCTAGMLRCWADPDFKNKLKAKHLIVQNRPDLVQHQREIQTIIQNSADVKEKNRQSQLRRYSDPKERAKATFIQKANWLKPGNIQRRIENSRRITEYQTGWRYIFYDHTKYMFKLFNDHIEFKNLYPNINVILTIIINNIWCVVEDHHKHFCRILVDKSSGKITLKWKNNKIPKSYQQ